MARQSPGASSTVIRLALVRLVFFVFMGVLILRLYGLQVGARKFYSDLAAGQHDLLAQLLPERGEVAVQDPLSDGLYPVAANLTLSLVYAVPSEMADAEYTATVLAPEAVRHYLGGDDYGQIIGFVGFVGDVRQGQYGIEQYWEEALAGVQGELKVEKEAGGGIIALGER